MVLSLKAAEADVVFPFTDGAAVVGQRSEVGMEYYYINRSGERIGQRSYAIALPFYENRAPVLDRETGLFGLIDSNGEWVVGPKYVALGHGEAPVCDARIAFITCKVDSRPCKGGYIDIDGNEVVVFLDVVYLQPFRNGAAVVRTDRQVGLVNTDGKWVWSRPVE